MKVIIKLKWAWLEKEAGQPLPWISPCQGFLIKGHGVAAVNYYSKHRNISGDRLLAWLSVSCFSLIIGPKALTTSFSDYSGPGFSLNYVECVGNETFLTDCLSSPMNMYIRFCDQNDYAGVSCNSKVFDQERGGMHGVGRSCTPWCCVGQYVRLVVVNKDRWCVRLDYSCMCSHNGSTHFLS